MCRAGSGFLAVSPLVVREWNIVTSSPIAWSVPAQIPAPGRAASSASAAASTPAAGDRMAGATRSCRTDVGGGGGPATHPVSCAPCLRRWRRPLRQHCVKDGILGLFNRRICQVDRELGVVRSLVRMACGDRGVVLRLACVYLCPPRSGGQPDPYPGTALSPAIAGRSGIEKRRLLIRS